MPEENCKLSNCQLELCNWTGIKFFFATGSWCDEMKYQTIVNSKWGVCMFVTRLTINPFNILVPPPSTPFTLPYPPLPGWLMEPLVFHQGGFAQSFMHFFAVIAPARFKLDWHRDVIYPSFSWSHPGFCQVFKDISCSFGSLLYHLNRCTGIIVITKAHYLQDVQHCPHQ